MIPGAASPLLRRKIRPITVVGAVVENRYARQYPDNIPDLSISVEKLCFIIAKAREFDAKDVVTDPDIFAMSEDEQVDLVTLAWLGRGDGTLEEWDELRAEAARAHNKRTAAYLLGMPLLPDYLGEALSQFGLSCEE